MSEKIKLLKASRRGTTMVEVLVAFLVVMLMMGMFSKVVTTSVSLLNRAGDNIKRMEAFSGEYLTIDAQARRSSKGKVALQLDGEKTATQNRPVNITLNLSGQLQVYTSSDNIKRYSFELPGLSNDPAED